MSRSVTAIDLQAALAQLGCSKTGKKQQLVERFCNALAAESELTLVGAGEAGCENAPRPRAVTRPVQELASKGANPLEDGWDESYFDGIEKDALLEAQALRPHCARINPAGAADSGVPSGVPRAHLETAKRTAQSIKPCDVAPPRDLAERLATLDPTQKAAVDLVHEWLAECCRGGAVPCLRGLLLGFAGTGKTHATKAFVDVVHAKCPGSVICVAPTGVAAQNLKEQGCETIHSVFRLMAGTGDHFGDIDEVGIEQFAASFEGKKLLVVDEVSMCGRGVLAQVSRRLDEAMHHLALRQLGSQPDGGCAASPQPSIREMFPHGFGGLSVILVGDFGQASPVLERTLLDPKRVTIEHEVANRSSNEGASLFRQFTTTGVAGLRTACVKLRRVYRNLDNEGPNGAFKDSQLRLRDCAPTPADYALWTSRDLDLGSLTEEEKAAAETEAVWIVSENAVAGERNGRKLGEHAARADLAIYRIEAAHSCERASGHGVLAEHYQQLRTVVHLAVGAPVMLLVNSFFGARVVGAGLNNGACGRVVSVQYAVGASPPALPQCVVVDFPGYTGPPFFPDVGVESRTWVPVPPVEVKHKRNSEYVRTQIPLRLAYCITIHKSQGLTILAFVVLDLSTKSGMASPASKPGLAFVGFTRCVSFGRIAFKNLPPLATFLSARSTNLFKLRVAFEETTDALHEVTLQSLWHRALEFPQDEVAAHLDAQSAKGALSAPFIADLRRMLSVRGVMPVPPETLALAAELLSKKTSDVKFGDLLKAFRGGGAASKFRSLGTGRRGQVATEDARLEAEQAVYWSAGDCSARHAFNMAAQSGVLPAEADAGLIAAAPESGLCSLGDLAAAAEAHAPGLYRTAPAPKTGKAAALFEGDALGLVTVAPGNKHKRRRYCAIVRVGAKYYQLDPADGRKILHPLKADEVLRFAKAKGPSGASHCLQVARATPVASARPAHLAGRNPGQGSPAGSKGPAAGPPGVQAPRAASAAPESSTKRPRTDPLANTPCDAPSRAPLLAPASPADRPSVRGLVNLAGPDTGRERQGAVHHVTRCFIIATAQCLFACRRVAEYLARHEASHRSLGRDLPSGESVDRCYACDLSRCLRATRAGGCGPLQPHEHNLWSGPAWVASGPGGAPCLQSAFPSATQHAADEYLMAAQARMRHADAILALRTAPGAEQPSSPFALTATSRRAAPCHECGLRAVVSTHDCDAAHVTLPVAGSDAVSLQYLIDCQHAFAGPGVPGAATCGAPLPDGSACAARVAGGAVADSWAPRVGSGAGCVVAISLDRALPAGGKNATQIISGEALAFAGGRWRISAAVRHVGRESSGGHYVAIVSTAAGDYFVVDDRLSRGPIGFTDAWSSIGREPSLIFLERVDE